MVELAFLKAFEPQDARLVRARNKGTEGIKSITEVIQRHEVHVGSRLIASVPLIRVLHTSLDLRRQWELILVAELKWSRGLAV